MQRTLSLTLSLFMAACGGGAASHGEPSTPPTSEERSFAATARRPQSLDEGLAAMGLSRIELEAHPTESRGSIGSEPVLSGGTLSVTETRGWAASPTVFAQREDGTIVIVSAAPTVIVDGHVDGGCQRFAGGRSYTQEIAYVLPEGASYGGVVAVPFEEHSEITDYSSTQADGSPCPPMLLD